MNAPRHHTFRVWAPRASTVDVLVGAPGGEAHDAMARHPMLRGSDGWWSAPVPGVGSGCDYAYSLDGGEPLPDPRSVRQPYGVHGPSRLVDHDAFGWTDGRWHGRPLAGAVIYEIHVGTFTPEGTFDAAADRLDHLVDLGVDFVQVMPVNAFDGDVGWGYDGVLWYATHEAYGGPSAFKRFVDACHALGLGVLLDVVYNHLGPSGACLDAFGPYTAGVPTDWGPSVNLDGPDSDEVRSYILDNVVQWVRDFHVDGLRLDATDTLLDRRATHLLEEIGLVVRGLQAHLGRAVVLIAESDLNDPRVIAPREAGGHGIDAQWDDDVHHALHAALTGESDRWYADFGTLGHLADALSRGFVLDGRVSSYRGRRHGRPVDVTRTPGWRLVAYLQNHDQIGNRPCGDRVSDGIPPGLLRVAAAVILTGPYTPMLFMGEEWAASTPFPFFSSFADLALAAAVRSGRRAEFERVGLDASGMLDPQAPATARAASLDWSEPATDGHAEVLAWYRDLLALRRARPELTDPDLSSVRVDVDERARTLVLYRGRVATVCNLSRGRLAVPVRSGGAGVGDILLTTADLVTVMPDSVTLDAESVAVVELSG